MKKEFFNNHIKDLIICIIMLSILSILMISFDFFEMLRDFSENHEEYELDEIFLIILCLPLVLSWYIYRRLQEINYINKNLEKKIEKELKLKLEQNRVLEKQAKNAVLGELLNNIAHQWRQPLNLITVITSSIKLNIENKDLEKKDLSNNLDLIMENANYLSKTIDLFRNFGKDENKKITKKEIKKTILDCTNIIAPSLRFNFIEIENHFNGLEKTPFYTLHNELQQVLLNIINNSKDAIIQNKIQNAKIILETNLTDDSILEIKIYDNAGGIKEDILDRVFEPYFTTKHKYQGTGLGLYIVNKIVAESLKGTVKINNYESGIKTIISIPNLIDY